MDTRREGDATDMSARSPEELTHGVRQLAGTDPDGNHVQLEVRGAIVSPRQPDRSWRIALDNPTTPA